MLRAFNAKCSRYLNVCSGLFDMDSGSCANQMPVKSVFAAVVPLQDKINPGPWVLQHVKKARGGEDWLALRPPRL